MSELAAILWDVDGTIAETERDGHRVAFNRAFAAAGLDWHWDVARYGELLRITGGRERILHDMAGRADAPLPVEARQALARRLHEAKNRLYAEQLAQEGMPLRPGVLALWLEAHERGLRQAIVTTTSRSNVEALLRLHLGESWHGLFPVCICGEDVRAKKPDPEAYLLALERLGLSPLQAVAIEDSPGGVAAARAAGVPVVVTRSAYFADAPIDGAVAIGDGLHERAGWRPASGATPREATSRRVGLDALRDWCARRSPSPPATGRGPGVGVIPGGGLVHHCLHI